MYGVALDSVSLGYNYCVVTTTPLLSFCLQPMVGAIAAGNCVVIKPGSYAAHSSNVMARLVPKYMDTDCIRVCEGNRHVTSALLEEKFNMIFFTGSTYVGKIVAQAAAKNLCPVVLELGGKSPCIIDESGIYHSSVFSSRPFAASVLFYIYRPAFLVCPFPLAYSYLP
jgi:acyl-CoA reductase-like NAD-dependent aldehyde dehydrogenase